MANARAPGTRADVRSAAAENQSRVITALAHRAAPLLALTALLATAQAPSPSGPGSPVPATGAPRWCTMLPLGTCRPLLVRAPRAMLRLAVVADDVSRARGLMNVASVAHGEGMLFAFTGGDERRYFWMKDTIAPLDMVFVRGSGVVTSVAADVPATLPDTPDDQIERRDGIGRYVIELGAGDAARLGIARGVKLVVPAVPAR
jgi:uncharacterized membrane protein (UPF0127 family)